VALSEATGAQIYCKLENLQRTGSFKERGARNALLLLGRNARRQGVVAASAGNHALGLEILRQVPDLEAVVCPIGGGGLIAGIAVAIKALRPKVRVIGVESTATGDYAAALRKGRPVRVARRATLADWRNCAA